MASDQGSQVLKKGEYSSLSGNLGCTPGADASFLCPRGHCRSIDHVKNSVWTPSPCHWGSVGSQSCPLSPVPKQEFEKIPMWLPDPWRPLSYKRPIESNGATVPEQKAEQQYRVFRKAAETGASTGPRRVTPPRESTISSPLAGARWGGS